MGLLNDYLPNCQRAKLNLRIRKVGRPRFALGLKSLAMGSKIKNGVTRLKNILFDQRVSFRSLLISSLDTFKSNFFLPSFSRRKDSIDKASKFSCQSTSSSFFRLTSGFPKDFTGHLIFPFSPDGYYLPPEVTSGRARSTSCNQISPPGVRKPLSFSCSWHIKNEGLPP